MEVSEGGLSVAQYTYDARNRRITKTVGAVINYVYDNSQVIEEYEDNTLARRFVYGPVIDDPLLLETGGERYYYLKDRRHSVTALTDAAGVVVERYEYSAFGLMSVYDSEGLGISGSALGNPYGYTGRRWDAESGLWHYRNRAYSPTLGRFMQRDPAGYVDGMNLYAYVMNNPLRFIDSNGLTAKEPGLFSRSFDSVSHAVGAHVGEESAMWYADKYNKTGNPVYAVGGALSSLWTPDTWADTAGVLATGGAVRAAAQNAPTLLKQTVTVAKEFIQEFTGIPLSNPFSGIKSLFGKADDIAAKGAYQIAKEGGKHSGFLRNYAGKSGDELERGMTSIERQIAEHRDKIANPEKYIPNFKQLDPRQQEVLINNKWPSDVQRQSEQLDILRGIRNDR